MTTELTNGVKPVTEDKGRAVIGRFVPRSTIDLLGPARPKGTKSRTVAVAPNICSLKGAGTGNYAFSTPDAGLPVCPPFGCFRVPGFRAQNRIEAQLFCTDTAWRRPRWTGA